MAPEIMRPFRRPDGYSKPADIWSLGCTVLEMIAGDVPFPEVTNNVAVLYKVGNLKMSPEIPASLPEDMKDCLARCLRKGPTERHGTTASTTPFHCRPPGSRGYVGSRACKTTRNEPSPAEGTPRGSAD